MATEVFTGVLTVSPGSGSHDFTMPPGMHAATIILDVVNPVGFNFWITAMDEPVPQLPYGGE
jgi:hypothetical protein